MNINNLKMRKIATDPKYRELMKVAAKLEKTPEYKASVEKRKEKGRKEMVKKLSGFFGKPLSGGKRKTRRKRRKQKGGTNPILFRGKGELIQRIREQIGPNNEGAIFETEEIINFTERNWGRNKKIYIKREDLENLTVEPPPHDFYIRLWHSTNIIPSYAIDNNGRVSVHRQNQMQALNAGPIVYGSVRIKKKDGEWFISQDINAGLNSGGYKKSRRKKKKSRKRRKKRKSRKKRR